MRKILDITVFRTPVDTLELLQKKWEYIIQMFSDYIMNSGDDFTEMRETNSYFKKITFSNELSIFTLCTEYIISDTYYKPYIIFSIQIADTGIPSELIENILNDTIRFFSWMFQDDYFIDYDDTYHIFPMNVGKKYSIEDIDWLNMDNRNTKENKKLLDSLLYLHYTLQNNIWDLKVSQWEIDTILAEYTSSWSIEWAMKIAKISNHTATEALIKNILILRTQIHIIISYFTTQ